MMLIDKLRAATKAAHEELDAALFLFIQQINTANEYTRLLAAFYGFFKPVSDAIDAHINKNKLPDYSTRRKPESLLHDLKTLDKPVNILLADNIPLIKDNAGAFGALYVLEGSTLGGLVIKKKIAGALNLQDESFQFFGGYGKHTRERWLLFLQALNTFAANNTEEETVIAIAEDTFVKLRKWLQQAAIIL